MDDPNTILSSLTLNRCPDCGGDNFRPGPRGGISQNIECRGCKSRFNIARYMGRTISADRIESETQGGGHWREDMFPQ